LVSSKDKDEAFVETTVPLKERGEQAGHSVPLNRTLHVVPAGSPVSVNVAR
jgi:hypothetical protein